MFSEQCSNFDFRYNKAEAKKRYEAAREFYEVAKISYDNKYWPQENRYSVNNLSLEINKKCRRVDNY